MKEQCSATPIDKIVSLSCYENSWKRVTKSTGGNDVKIATEMATIEEI